MIHEVFQKKNVAWKEMIQKLVVENCLTFGQHSRLTSKKVTKYLVGTRATTEIFKLYELRYLLLKIYPLIHNLFYNPRLNSYLEKKTIPNFLLQKISTSTLHGKPIFKNKPSSKIILNSKKKKQNFKKTKFSFKLKQKNLLPQILFATTTPAFASIVKHAAQICNMPWHQNRWFNGFMTAGMPLTAKKNLWNFLGDSTQNQIYQYVRSKWDINKNNYEKIREKNIYSGQSRWPSLLLIPDLSNNSMIVAEAKKLNLPIVGMVNSHCSLEIDYPIFAQDQTIQSVHFFCYFMATLIAKENVYLQHKRHTLQKVVRKPLTITNNLYSREKNAFVQKRVVKFQNLVWKVNKKNFWNKSLFFQGIKPIRKKQLVRQRLLTRPYFFSTALTKKRLSPFQKYLSEHTPPPKLRFRLLHLYLKSLTQSINSTRISMVLIKKLIDFYMLKGDKIKTNSLINIEKKNRYFKRRSVYFWNVQEKQKIWTQLQHYAKINKIIDKQWRNPIYKPKRRFWLHSNYYWVALQQWHNDLKWSGQKYILNSIIMPKVHLDELMVRQRIGSKWKSRLKCYVNSRSYKYVPRTEYLIEQEKKKTKDWIYKLVNTIVNTNERKWFGQSENFKTHNLKKQYLQQQYRKKQKRKYQKTRQAWHKH
jgi:ribosomal protein S2